MNIHMDYFILFGGFTIILLVAIAFILKLIWQMNNLPSELKLTKVTNQTSLDILEDRITRIATRDTDTYLKEIKNLEKLHKSLTKLVYDKETEISSSNRLNYYNNE